MSSSSGKGDPIKEVSVKDVWNEAADPWTDFVRSGLDITRNEMSNPAMFELLGDIKGYRILDIACGEGYNTREMARKEASMTGVDISDVLIRNAIEQETSDRMGIDYSISDAADLGDILDDSFDIVTCFMAIMDIQNYNGAIAEAGRILVPGGRFIFNMPHPCFEIRTKNGENVGGWVYPKSNGSEMAGQGSVTSESPLHYIVDNYFDTDEPEEIPWKMERLKRSFTTVAYHRTLTDYSEALHSSGLLISRIREPQPTKKGIEELSVLGHCLRIPHSITIEAVKP